MRIETARELTNYLNTNYITPFTKAYFALNEEYDGVVRIYVNDVDDELIWVAEWSKASHETFRSMLYNMKCTPINLGK